jgi:serine/threonine-protein kinase
MKEFPTPSGMTAEAALELVERLVYDHSGAYLSDLERQVFLGSWQGQTYEEIYPLHPEYIEKSVGYRLWRKLSDILGEKVSKKRIRGAVMRLAKTLPSALPLPPESPDHSARCILITHHQDDPTASELAEEMKDLLQSAGHQVMIDPPIEPPEIFLLDTSLPGAIAPTPDNGNPPWDWILLVNPISICRSL